VSTRIQDFAFPRHALRGGGVDGSVPFQGGPLLPLPQQGEHRDGDRHDRVDPVVAAGEQIRGDVRAQLRESAGLAVLALQVPGAGVDPVPGGVQPHRRGLQREGGHAVVPFRQPGVPAPRGLRVPVVDAHRVDPVTHHPHPDSQLAGGEHPRRVGDQLVEQRPRRRVLGGQIGRGGGDDAGVGLADRPAQEPRPHLRAADAEGVGGVRLGAHSGL
jgi:hypothetical protein